MGHDGAAMLDRGPRRPRRTTGTAQSTEAVVVRVVGRMVR